MPLSGPAIATVAILTFLPIWNAYLWPLMVVQSEGVRPVMVGLQYFFKIAGGGGGGGGVRVGRDHGLPVARHAAGPHPLPGAAARLRRVDRVVGRQGMTDGDAAATDRGPASDRPSAQGRIGTRCHHVAGRLIYGCMALGGIRRTLGDGT